MFHPYCIDSSVIFNVNGERKRKTKLKTLFEMFMGGKIQDGFGHDSVEDAASALKLVQFKLTKCKSKLVLLSKRNNSIVFLLQTLNLVTSFLVST
jgi:hypothetical protein